MTFAEAVRKATKIIKDGRIPQGSELIELSDKYIMRLELKGASIVGTLYDHKDGEITSPPRWTKTRTFGQNRRRRERITQNTGRQWRS